MSQSSFTKYEIYLAWFIVASFFLYQYILRSMPGVLIDEVRHTFNLDADHFALIGAMFYYGYSFVQIPLGIVIDKKGTRITVIVSILLCVLGNFLFISTSNSIIAYISRLIIGLGAASAFMSSVKLANDYFPESQRKIAIGATLTFGSIGALVTGKPLNYLINTFDSWKTSFLFFSILGFILLLLAFLYLPKTQKEHNVESNNYSFNDIKRILNNKKILIYAFIAIGLFAPLSVMADLWGTAFLICKFNLSRELAAPILMNIYIGMAVGSIVLPIYAHKYGINKLITYSSVVLLILFSLMVYLDNLSINQLTILLIMIGFFCGSEMLCFTAALCHTPLKFSGLTIGIVNTLNMLSGALMQQVIGIYLDFSWSGQVNSHGLKIYSLHEFVAAFSILVIIILLCTIIAFVCLKEKNKIEHNQ